MANVTYYVALPFLDSEEGPVAGQGQEHQSASLAIAAARSLATKPGHVGAVAFKRTGDPALGEFQPGEILRTFGNLPQDLSEL